MFGFLLTDFQHGFFNGFIDLQIAGAAAQVAGQGFTNLFTTWIGRVVEESLGSDEDPWRAVAALSTAKVSEGFL